MYNQIKNKLITAGATITSEELGKPADDLLIKRIEKEFEIQIPKEIKDFYKQHNGISIFWETRNQVAGWINIWSLERMFGGYHATAESEWRSDALEEHFWPEGYHEGRELAFRKSLRMLEDHNGLDSSTAISFDKNGEVKVYYVNFDSVIELPFTFVEYCNFIEITLGVDEARYYLQDPDFYQNSIFNFLPDLKNSNLINSDELNFMKGRKPKVLFER